jgi:uncharacterized lipoprotein YajG
MKFIFKIVTALNSNSGTMPLRESLFGVAAILFVMCYGCARPLLELTYHPQENVIPIEEASNIAVKVTVNDLRTKASNLRDANEVGILPSEGPRILLIAKNDLRELTTHSVETELINRGFKLGERVLVEIDFIKFYSYWMQGWVTAEIILYVDVKSSEGTPVFSKLIREIGAMKGSGKEEHVKTALDAALKEGVSRLANDQEFIMALIKANRD